MLKYKKANVSESSNKEYSESSKKRKMSFEKFSSPKRVQSEKSEFTPSFKKEIQTGFLVNFSNLPELENCFNSIDWDCLVNIYELSFFLS